MRFMVIEGGAPHEVQVTGLSDVNLRQSAAIADAIARLIPHEGVDYLIDLTGGTLSFKPETDKGVQWCSYLRSMMAKNPPDIKVGPNAKIEMLAYITGVIPKDGIDYDSVITFKGPKSKEVSYRLTAYNEKGTFWRDYVSVMLKKYPPHPDYRADMLPDNPDPVVEVPKEFMEV